MAEDFESMILIFSNDDVTVFLDDNPHGAVQVVKSSNETKKVPIECKLLYSVVRLVGGVDVSENVKGHSAKLGSFVVLAVYG